MKKTEAMINVVKEKAEKKEKHVLKIIEQMRKRGDKISIYSVAKEAEVSRNYLYNNEFLFEIINNERSSETKKREESSSETVINALKMKVTKLEREISILKKEDYKEKYIKVCRENEELKKQLETAYKY